MIATDTSPEFRSTADYLARLDDAGFWHPHAVGLFKRHGIDAPDDLTAGRGGTFPTVLAANAVVKLFGHLPFWRTAYEAERAALRLVARDPRIAAPSLLGEGRLFDEPTAPWPYLVTTRMPGTQWGDAALSADQMLAIAAELGRQVGRIHALRPTPKVATLDSWASPDLSMAAQQTVLPQRLVAQVDEFTAQVPPSDPVFVHGDLMFRHVFVEGEHFGGIIDWGDALVTNRHYELAQIHLNLFDGDKTLLRTFLEQSNWPVEPAFAHQALAQAFRRQAVGLAQHRTMDVFYRVPDLVPLPDIETLDELAGALFGV